MLIALLTFAHKVNSSYTDKRKYMAIRRVSDLPELKTQYPDAVLGKCLFEVSYNHVNKLY